MRRRTPDETAKKKSKPRRRSEGAAGGEPAGVVETTFGKELAKGIRSRKTKLPVFYPTGPRVRVRLRPEAARLQDQRDRRGRSAELRARRLQVGVLAPRAGRVLRRSWAPAGRTRRSSRTPTTSGRSATGPTSSSTTATGCGWSPGRRTRAPTGSPTRSRQSLTDREMLEIAKGMTELPKAGERLNDRGEPDRRRRRRLGRPGHRGLLRRARPPGRGARHRRRRRSSALEPGELPIHEPGCPS